MSSTFLRDEIRKKKGFIHDYNTFFINKKGIGIQMSGNGLLLAGETRPSSSNYIPSNSFLNLKKDSIITNDEMPINTRHNSDDIRTSGRPNVVKPKITRHSPDDIRISGGPNVVKPKITRHSPDDIRISGGPRAINYPTSTNTKMVGRPIDYVPRYMDLLDTLEKATPYLEEGAAELAELLMMFL